MCYDNKTVSVCILLNICSHCCLCGPLATVSDVYWLQNQNKTDDFKTHRPLFYIYLSSRCISLLRRVTEKCRICTIHHFLFVIRVNDILLTVFVHSISELHQKDAKMPPKRTKKDDLSTEETIQPKRQRRTVKSTNLKDSEVNLNNQLAENTSQKKTRTTVKKPSLVTKGTYAFKI